MNVAKKPDEQAISKDWKPIYRRWWFWVIEVPFLLFVALLILRAPFYFANEKSKEVVAQIHAQKLTLADVNGDNLPPQPDPAKVDATIEGVDANGNGIRDDVELAIFKKYPNSAKIRAAELQYAKALQVHLTLATNGDLYIFANDLEGLSASCLKNFTLTPPPPPTPSESFEKWDRYYDKGDALIGEVKDRMLNTSARRNRYDQIPESKATNYSLAQNDPACTLKPSSLPN